VLTALHRPHSRHPSHTPHTPAGDSIIFERRDANRHKLLVSIKKGDGRSAGVKQPGRKRQRKNDSDGCDRVQCWA
jgi:hypothetical protein